MVGCVSGYIYIPGILVFKSHVGSAPGINRISYKLYIYCPNVLKQLTLLLQRAWKKDIVPQKWYLADSIWQAKEKMQKALQIFRIIYFLNVQGKHFFFVRRMTDFLLGNYYINTAIQKAVIPGFPNCLEHPISQTN